MDQLHLAILKTKPLSCYSTYLPPSRQEPGITATPKPSGGCSAATRETMRLGLIGRQDQESLSGPLQLWENNSKLTTAQERKKKEHTHDKIIHHLLYNYGCLLWQELV